MYYGYRTERRKFQRLVVSISVICKILSPQKVVDFLGDGEFEAETLNISEGGLALAVNNFIPNNTRLYMRVVIVESDAVGAARFYEPLSIIGNVRSSVLWENYRYRLGLAFDEVSAIEKRVISDLVRSPLKEYLV